MNFETLVVVMAHREAQATFDRHYSYWKSHDADMLVVCPQDSVIQTKEDVLAIGRRSHHGEEANARFLRMLSLIGELNYNDFIIYEYDSLCIDCNYALIFPDLAREMRVLRSNQWDNTEPHKFRGRHYFHPPLAFSIEVLTELNKVAIAVRPSDEGGFWDRLLGVMVDMANLQADGWGLDGFSRNTIEPHDLPAAIEAKRKGAVWFHGIKTEQCLRALEKA